MVNLIQLAKRLSQPLVADFNTIDNIMTFLSHREFTRDYSGAEKEKREYVDEYQGIPIMHISGTLVARVSEMDAMCTDFISTTELTQQFLALAETNENILLWVDTGGGEMTGVPEFAEAIRNSKATVYGFCDTVAASGGYWILSACDEVVATPSARVGSIGVYIPVMKNKENPFSSITYFSAGACKVYGAADVAMTEAESSHFQSRVNASYEWFTEDVANYRGKTVEEIKGTEAAVFSAKESVGLLVDRLVNNITEV